MKEKIEEISHMRISNQFINLIYEENIHLIYFELFTNSQVSQYLFKKKHFL